MTNGYSFLLGSYISLWMLVLFLCSDTARCLPPGPDRSLLANSEARAVSALLWDLGTRTEGWTEAAAG